MSGFTSGGGGGDPFRGMSKGEKPRAGREMQKCEAERGLELANADLDALLGPSAAMMRELVQTSPELAEYMRTNIFK